MPRRKDNEIYKYKLKGGKVKFGFKTYVGINKATGKPIKVTRQGFETRKEAESAKTKLKADGVDKILTKRKFDNDKKTVQEVYESWLPIYRTGVKGSSVVQVKSIWDNRIQPEFGNDYINHIDVDHLQRFANEMSQKYVGYRRTLNELHRLIKYAILRDWCDKDPFDKILIPKKSAKPKRDTEHNFYELKDLKAFLATAKKHNYKYYTFFMILANLGVRRGEALGLKWSDIDFKNKLVHIKRTTTFNEKSYKAIGSPKTPASKRDLSLPSHLIEVLQKYRSMQVEFNSDDDYIFHTKTGDYLPPTAPTYWINSVYNQNEDLKEITPHGFRHTLATLLYDDDKYNITPKDVQTILGHKNVTEALEIYTHVTSQQKKKITESINNLGL